MRRKLKTTNPLLYVNANFSLYDVEYTYVVYKILVFRFLRLIAKPKKKKKIIMKVPVEITVTEVEGQK